MGLEISGFGYRRQMLRFALVIMVMLAGCSVSADEPAVAGRASVIDGDTLEVQGRRIRLWGVDAPEGRQTCTRAGASYRCGQVAANQLDRHIAGRPVVCVQVGVNRYRRVVARCAVAGEDLGGWLVREGYAVRYPEYAGTAYLVEEAAARRARRGVWAGQFDLPWEWRRSQRG